MKVHERNVGMIGENQRECGLRTEHHKSKVCSRKDTSVQFKPMSLFDFSRKAYRNSTWKSVAFRVILGASTNMRKASFNFVISVCPHGSFRL
jgi:hypothetical protein